MKLHKLKPRAFHPLGLGPKLAKRFRRLTVKGVVRGLVMSASISLVVIALLFAWYSKDLPTPGKIQKRQPAQATQIFDRTGAPLYAVFGDEKRISIPQADIPETIREATIAVEDKDFYKHHGLDFRGLVRGVILRPLTGQRAQGGSTITQQYVKNALLTNERSIDRKIKELIITLEVEFMFTKDEILTMYLNEIPYGSNAYGIEAASQTFFNKSAKDLTLAEASYLASLPQRPSYLSPYGSHTDELDNRKNYVLDRMGGLGFVSVDEADAAKAIEVVFVPRREHITAPHFVFYVRDLLIEKYGERAVLEGGLKVQTSLDPNAQRAAEDAIAGAAKKLPSYDAGNAAVVAVDPKTGHVLAMVGSVDYFDQENQGNFNVTTATRQPGSSFKPITYATGFKGKWSPSSTLWDVQTDFGNYTPQNYDGRVRGPVTIRASLANSFNIPAVKMLALSGISDTLKTAEDMGITTLNQPDRYGLSLVLGGAEVKPIELAAAYAVFGANGVYHTTNPILKVQDNTGKTLEEWKDDKRQALAPEIAYQITSILTDNDARTPVFGARSPLYFADRPVAAKTGTTSEYHDGWTVGYTPSVATAVWVGNNDNTPMDAAGGVKAAGPIFHQFMVNYVKGPAEQFERPAGLKEVTVDALSGKLPTESSPQTVTDLFASWQIPTERDDVHVAVEVNKLNGKLATELTPPELRETRTYTRIHSEKPKDSRWENPVIEWAKSHGFDLGDPPTEKDDFDATQLPSIILFHPLDQAVVSGSFEILVEPTALAGMRSVEYFVDGVLVATRTAASWAVSYDASLLTDGNHEIQVTVTDNLGSQARVESVILVARDETAPGSVTSVTASPLGNGRSGGIKLAWSNPHDSDLIKVRIYRSLQSGTLGTMVQEVKVEPGTADNATINGHAAGTMYYFTLRAVDTAGNENGATGQVSVLAI